MSSLREKLAASGAAILSVETLNHVFDYFLFPFVILSFGVTKGWVIMTILAMLLNYLMIRIYSRSKYDWYGFEHFQLEAQKHSCNWKGTIIRLGRVPAFIFLSWEDPFKAFIFARGKKGAGYWFNGVDWLTFLGANVIGTIIWTGMLGTGINVIKRIIFG